MPRRDWKKAATLQGALVQYEQAIKEKPTLVTGYLGRGRCLLQMNQPKDAEQAFRDAVKADGHSIEAKVELAKVLEARKNYMETKIQLGDAYMIDPKNLQVRDRPGLRSSMTRATAKKLSKSIKRRFRSTLIISMFTQSSRTAMAF